MAHTEMTCSFCGKRANEVERLIAGPKVFICDGCVDACIEILSSDAQWRENQIANLRRLSQRAEAESQTRPGTGLKRDSNGKSQEETQ